VNELPKREISLDCGDYLLRTLTKADASAHWGAWMSDPKNLRLLNSPPKTMSEGDIAAYIDIFDQRSHLLIGIFQKASGLLVGFFRLDLDPRLKRCLMFLMIGEQKFRHWSTLDPIRVPIQDYIFDVLGCKVILATVLVSNKPMTRYMLRIGWRIDHTAAAPVKGGKRPVDLNFLSLSREAWQAWKANNL
jgi:RimJ/RimL family protein N-acetyltransferase